MCNRWVAILSFSTLCVCLLFGPTVKAFSSVEIIHRQRQQSTTCSSYNHDRTSSNSSLEPATTSRRDLLAGVASTMAIGVTAILTDPSSAFAASPSSIEEAKNRFQEARKELKDLVDNYSDIAKIPGGGDAVRNALGTQGVNSKLFGIQKVLKTLTEASEDIVEYSEAMEEFNAYYFQAEGAAYQSLFVEHSSAKSTPESCLATAKQDIIQMQTYMDLLAQQLNL
jgi:hypothetical protein